MGCPGIEFINALVYPEEESFSPKHLAEFAVEALTDPHIRIRNLSLVIPYCLVLVADKANWPGQRERFRKRFAEAIARIPEIKLEYAFEGGGYERGELEEQARINAESILRECGKVDDLEFEQAVKRALKRRLRAKFKVSHL